MNREIKFKGWCERDSEWRIGFYVSDGLVHEILTMMNSGGLYASSIDPESLGQYTGLKDINGVEIYEGDILAAPFANGSSRKDIKKKVFNCPVEITTFMGATLKTNSIQMGSYRWYPEVEDCKVIGNIYENPELLEE